MKLRGAGTHDGVMLKNLVNHRSTEREERAVFQWPKIALGQSLGHERKEWATGPIAQEIHTHLMAITHNLLTLLLYKLEKDHGIKEEKLLKKHGKMEEKRKANNSPHLVFYDIARKCLQFSHQFIRLVRNLIGRQTPFREALKLFRQRLNFYL